MRRKAIRNILQTITGRRIDLDVPKPEQIHIIDIAYGLSHMPRFAGQTPIPYDVATHSWLVSKIIEASGGSVLAQLQGLLHDAAEAYLSDLPSPVKMRCPDYQRLEKRLFRAIAKRFGIPAKLPPNVKEADDEALEVERQVFQVEYRGLRPPPLHRTRNTFLQRFEDLYWRHLNAKTQV